MKYFLYFTSLLLLDLHTSFAEISKDENTADPLEDMRKCMWSAKALQQEPQNEKKMKQFYDDCQAFLKKLQLTNNQKRILEKLGYKSKQLPVALRAEFEAKDTFSEKEEPDSLNPDEEKTLTRSAEPDQANFPSREIPHGEPSAKYESPPSMDFHRDESVEESLKKIMGKPPIPQPATLDNMLLHIQNSEGSGKAVDPLSLRVQNLLNQEGFAASAQGFRQQNLGSPNQINVPPPNAQRTQEQRGLNLQQQNLRQEGVRRQGGIPKDKPVHAQATPTREAAYQGQQANLRAGEDPSRFRTNTGNQFAHPQARQRPPQAPQTGPQLRRAAPQPMRKAQYPPNAQRTAPRRNNFGRFPNRFDEL